jgi:hypothetical protein
MYTKEQLLHAYEQVVKQVEALPRFVTPLVSVGAYVADDSPGKYFHNVASYGGGVILLVIRTNVIQLTDKMDHAGKWNIQRDKIDDIPVDFIEFYCDTVEQAEEMLRRKIDEVRTLLHSLTQEVKGE